MSLIEKNVLIGQKENAINKRNTDYSLKANLIKKQDYSRKPQKIEYGKSSLLNKIIASSLNENMINNRLEQISYSAINGQRQQAETFKPEGVQMLGQMGREKPLGAITKEMIKEYQETEQQPYMIDGEARKYMKADFEPVLQLPTPIDDIKDNLRELYKQKVATSKTIKDAEDNIRALDDYYKGFIREINIYGMNAAKKAEKDQLEKDKVNLKMEYDKLRNDLDKINFEMKNQMDLGKEINRQNALIPEKNKQEVAKYEEALMRHNRNRLNLQQQPYESDMEYYKRLKDIESEKIDPVLYKQLSVNKVLTMK